MAWWNDLWLNESFATYMAYLAKERATRFKNSWVSFASGEKTWAYRQDQLPTTHPIVADIPDVEATHLNFDGITYAKGASVLKQLVAWVGEDAFFKGLVRYFKKHEYGNTELPDFLSPLAKESGRDLDAWSKKWLETAGVNTIRVDADAKVVTQEATDAYPTLRPHRIGVGLFDAAEGGLVLRKEFELDVVGARTEAPQLEPVDLVLPNHKDLAYAKIRLDERSLQTLTERLRDLGDPLARTLCWGAVWDMLRDGELAARRYLDIVLNNIDGETDIGVVLDLLGSARSAIETYGDPSNADAARAKLYARSRELMDAADPGSDFQLTFAKGMIATARDGADVDFVRGLLDGSTSVDGLEIDTDRRWAIVTALAAIGAVSDDVIAAELELDPTDQGERHAAAARAARPTAEAKEEAWAHATEDAEITLAMLRALAVGFRGSDDVSLVEPYSARYFDELLAFWEKRELDLGLAFIGGMFPRVYTDDVVKRADALLEKGVPGPVKRLLLEAKDDTLRVMRARAADRA
jgi:aminopeptidase N